LKKIVPLKTCFATKEKWGLIAWPFMAIIMELFQEKIVYDLLDVSNTLKVFFLSIIVFAFAIWVFYRNAQTQK